MALCLQGKVMKPPWLTHKAFTNLASAYQTTPLTCSSMYLPTKCNHQNKPHSLAMVCAKPSKCHKTLRACLLELNLRITLPESVPWLLSWMRWPSSEIHSSHFITCILPLDFLMLYYWPLSPPGMPEGQGTTCVSRAEHREKRGQGKKIKPIDDKNLLPLTGNYVLISSLPLSYNFLVWGLYYFHTFF